MKKLTIAIAVMVVGLYAANASAQDVAAGGGFKKFAVGAHIDLGIATIVGPGYEELRGLDDDEKTARFAAAGGAYFVFYFTQMVGIQAGIDFIGKGARAKGETANIDWVVREQLVYMQIPIAVRLNINIFQMAAGLAFNFALSGKTKTVIDDDTDWDGWDDDDWDYVRRFNIAPWLWFGAAIPVGPISIVPGISWSLHLINDFDREEINDDFGLDEDDLGGRAMNIMFHIGAEFGF